MAMNNKKTLVYVKGRLPVAGVVISGILILLGIMFFSVGYGVADIDKETIWNSIVSFDKNNLSHQIMYELRFPRVLAGAIIGAGFAVCGAIMQAITRNPLADSGILGINAGAGIMVAICFVFMPSLSFTGIAVMSFLGAGMGMALVIGIGLMTRKNSLQIILIGSAITAFLTALSQGLIIRSGIGQDLAFWYAGGLAGARFNQVTVVGGCFVLAMVMSVMLSPSITALSMGEDIAASLGINTKKVKLLSFFAVTLFAGSSVAMVGNIGFIGIVIPHVTRKLVGTDYRAVIPCSATLGALLVVLADLGARSINPPHEIPVAAIIAAIGVPFFLLLARKKG
jgi:iron complex transport system permease protein